MISSKNQISGRAIRERRGNAGATRDELARLAGYTASSIARIEALPVITRRQHARLHAALAKLERRGGVVKKKRLPTSRRLTIEELQALTYQEYLDRSPAPTKKQWPLSFEQWTADRLKRVCRSMARPRYPSP